MDAVSAQMFQSFTDAGYTLREGASQVTKDGGLMFFAKGSTTVMMFVSSTGKNEVSCALRLSTT